MKIFISLTVALICSLLSFQVLASTTTAPGELEDLIQYVNNSTTSTQFTRSCPGIDLVLSCGNFICESNKGESETTCPADCITASVRSYNQQTLCQEVKQVFTPANEAEAQNNIKEALKTNQHVKVIGNSHSANSILCTNGIVIATEKMNHIFGTEKFEEEDTVRVEPGVTLTQLTNWLDTKKLSLGYSIMGFNGVSIAGAISTGSHGSSTKHTAVISNIVKSISMIEADGQVHHYSEKTTPLATWKSVRAGLGLLGMITEIRLKTFPQKNLEVKVTYGSEDDFIKTGNVFELVKDCDWGQINWFPGAKSYMKSCGTETSLPAQNGANNRLVDPSLPNFFVKPVKQIMQYAACNPNVACALDKIRYLTWKIKPPFEYINSSQRAVSSKSLVGSSHRMMSSGLTPLQKGFFQMDWEIAVPKSKAHEALKAVKAHILKNNICLPLVGVFLRFAPSEDKTWMAHTASGSGFAVNEPVVFIEMPVYLPSGFSPSLKQEYDRAYEEFARMLIQNYGGRAHWGKNRDWTFELERDQKVFGDNFIQFQKVVSELDPKGTFSNSFGDLFGVKY